jgi:hypothetical protein
VPISHLDAEVTHARALIAAHARHDGPDDSRTVESKRLLKAAKAERFVRQLVDSAPPLTPEQRDRLAAILRSAPIDVDDDGGGRAA